MNAFLAAYPPHVRQVIILAGAALVLTLLAIVSAIATREPTRRGFTPEPYFPGLAQHTQEIRRVHIQDKTHSADLTYADETGWVVGDKDGYRARFDKIQELVRALVDLERFDKKTADAKWHERLLLTDPRQEGEATLVQLFGTSDKPIAEMLIGENADADAASGKAQVYARAPSDNQVWLARGAGLSPDSDGADWLNTEIINVPKARIARAEIAPEGAPAYVLVRATPEAENFTVESMPAKMRLKSDTAADNTGTALAQFALRDVASADRITFAPGSSSASYQTFNGLRIRIDTAKLGNDTWVRVIPSTTPAADAQAKDEAADLARRLSPWVFQIESWKASQIEAKLDSMLEPASATANPVATTPPKRK